MYPPYLVAISSCNLRPCPDMVKRDLLPPQVTVNSRKIDSTDTTSSPNVMIIKD
jgi:hypothetical protein